MHADAERPLITREPENSETPLPRIRSWVTPNRLFFVRNHFPEPDLERDAWRLSVHGRVRRPRVWSCDELLRLPHRTVFATLECAGNGRSFLHPPEPGVQWGAGAVGHAEWTGVPLGSVLEQAAPLENAIDVLCEGADVGTEPDHPEPMPFARGLPLAKALHPDTLIAFRMNGEPLTRSHGAPARLIVPGWYGVCSVKWLTRLEVLDHPFEGYFQTHKYTIRQRDEHGERVAGLTRGTVKSEILTPEPGGAVAAGVVQVMGIAWAGEEPVAGVEVSTDGGRTWEAARLAGPQAPYSWTLWEYLWQARPPGPCELRSRARSASGETQPDEHDPLRGGYVINFVRPHPVRVVDGPLPGAGEPQSLLYDMAYHAEKWTHRRLDVEMEGFADGGGI